MGILGEGVCVCVCVCVQQTVNSGRISPRSDPAT